MRRRSVVFAAAAGVGIVGGLGLALWSDQARRPASPAEPEVDVWQLSFERAAGPRLAMQTLRGRPLLLNFWATWCVPCVTEMPLIDAFARAQRAAGWQVLALAIDQRDPVERFVREKGLSLEVALGGASGLDLSRTLGNSVGALPFSAVFASDGQVAGRKLGALDAGLLASWVSSVH